jgi:hypothetical protein
LRAFGKVERAIFGMLAKQASCTSSSDRSDRKGGFYSQDCHGRTTQKWPGMRGVLEPWKNALHAVQAGAVLLQGLPKGGLETAQKQV